MTVLTGACAWSCDSEGDPPSPAAVPSPAGKDKRIRDVADPASPTKAAHQTQVAVSGAVVVAVDQYDETGNGKSSGTIYVSDLGGTEPYSGISLYNPSFIPGNLRVSPGDALDLRGEFQENQNIPIPFAPGAFLVQLANPIGTFRFDANVPAPVTFDKGAGRPIKIEDFAEYTTGRRWLNMLVRVENVTLSANAFSSSPGGSGRINAGLLPDMGKSQCTDPFPKVPTLANELMDLGPLALKAGTVIKSLTGVVTFFCNFHIAPRSAADIVVDAGSSGGG